MGTTKSRSRARKLWVNTRKRKAMQDQSFNSFVEMAAVDKETQGFDMYVDGALYTKACQIIVRAAEACTDKETAKKLTQGLIDLAEF